MHSNFASLSNEHFKDFPSRKTCRRRDFRNEDIFPLADGTVARCACGIVVSWQFDELTLQLLLLLSAFFAFSFHFGVFKWIDEILHSVLSSSSSIPAEKFNTERSAGHLLHWAAQMYVPLVCHWANVSAMSNSGENVDDGQQQHRWLLLLVRHSKCLERSRWSSCHARRCFPVDRHSNLSLSTSREDPNKYSNTFALTEINILSKYWQFERQTNTIDRLVLTVPSNDCWPRGMFRDSCLI